MSAIEQQQIDIEELRLLADKLDLKLSPSELDYFERTSPASGRLLFMVLQLIDIHKELSKTDFTKELDLWNVPRPELDKTEFQRQLFEAITFLLYVGGKINAQYNKYFEAVKYLSFAKEMAKLQEDGVALANILVELGHTYKSILNLNKARLAYKDALRLFKQLGDEEKIAETNASLAALEIYQGRTDDARQRITVTRKYTRTANKQQATAKLDDLLEAADYVEAALLMQGRLQKENSPSAS